MNWARLALRTLGRRLPKTQGTIAVDGLDAKIWIGRDRFAVPHIRAESDLDGWFGLGFCQGQDRAFQLETRLRLVRGTLAALVGSDAVPLDRLARRIDFAGCGRRGLESLVPDQQQRFEAFAAGIRAGVDAGKGGRAHEFTLLRTRPSAFTAADAIGFLAVQSFSLASNWDAELARLRMLALDGPDAVRDLHPGYPSDHPTSDRPGESAVAVVDALADDLALAGTLFEAGGGSNNWAIAGSRTRSGRPIVANDPHLAPMLPAHWYLAHIETPEWSIVGGSIPAIPAFGFGHNGFAAWGVTAGLIDNTDLFVEEIGDDGTSVRRGDDFTQCRVRTETITVRGSEPVTIDVLETDRGPIVGPAFEGPFGALSMSATWFESGDVGTILDIGRFGSFEALHTAFRTWSSVPLNVVYGDESGSIGWQLIGAAPRRGSGGGTIPTMASDPETRWSDERVPYEEMPRAKDPQAGFIVTANNLPSSGGPYLGSDFLDGFRAQRIAERLAERTDWTVADTLALQTDQFSIPWRQMGPTVLEACSQAGDLGIGIDLLRDWDGRVTADSPAATVFEVFVAALAGAIARSRAPNSAEFALGAGFTPLVPFSSLMVRRVSHLVGLIQEQPEGWFDRGWDEALREALRSALDTVRRAAGSDPRDWAWGKVRTLTLIHPMGMRRPLDRIWNIGPLPHGGDANTVNPAPVDPRNPLADPGFAIASARMAVEVGVWDAARFCVPGGQSGNPLSRHYSDQVRLWVEGDAMVVPFTRRAVDRTIRTVLELTTTRR